MSWEMVKLGDIATYINGCAFKPSDWSKSGLPIIRIQNLTNQDADYNYFDGKYKSQYEINNGEILISWSATLGVFKWNKGKALLNQHIFKVIFDKKNIDKNYFVYVVNSELQNLIGNTHGSTMKHITKNRFENHLIPLPPLETQKKIVNILDKAQELINKRKQQIDLMDSLVQSLFYDMFGDLQFNHKKIPLKPLETLTSKITDGVHQKPTYYNVGIPFISVKDIISGKIVFDNCKFISKEAHSKYINRCKPEKGDILYTKVGARYGRPAIVETNNDFSIYVSLALIKPINNLINSIYLQEALKTEYVYRQAFNSIKGIGVPDLHLKEIKKFQIPVPPLNTQTQFAEKVEKIETQKQKMQNSLKDLEQNFSSLMQRAFKGEI
ncbi:MAG: restriction endonuclease subunit S [Desulforegulaceae bacterium]|nr:restriction endonuclease subunit S [Desulforegulaceae bacterium]